MVMENFFDELDQFYDFDQKSIIKNNFFLVLPFHQIFLEIQRVHQKNLANASTHQNLDAS